MLLSSDPQVIMVRSHRCPFPIGWLVDTGACLAFVSTGNDDGGYTSQRPLYFYQKDIVVTSIHQYCFMDFSTGFDFYLCQPSKMNLSIFVYIFLREIPSASPTTPYELCLAPVFEVMLLQADGKPRGAIPAPMSQMEWWWRLSRGIYPKNRWTFRSVNHDDILKHGGPLRTGLILSFQWQK